MHELMGEAIGIVRVVQKPVRGNGDTRAGGIGHAVVARIDPADDLLRRARVEPRGHCRIHGKIGIHQLLARGVCQRAGGVFDGELILPARIHHGRALRFRRHREGFIHGIVGFVRFGNQRNVVNKRADGMRALRRRPGGLALRAAVAHEGGALPGGEGGKMGIAPVDLRTVHENGQAVLDGGSGAAAVVPDDRAEGDLIPGLRVLGLAPDIGDDEVGLRVGLRKFDPV